jgi:hypothetical protein
MLTCLFNASAVNSTARALFAPSLVIPFRVGTALNWLPLLPHAGSLAAFSSSRKPPLCELITLEMGNGPIQAFAALAGEDAVYAANAYAAVKSAERERRNRRVIPGFPDEKSQIEAVMPIDPC